MYLQSARSACEVMELSAVYNPDMSMLPARPHGPSDSCVNCIFVAHAVNWRVCEAARIALPGTIVTGGVTQEVRVAAWNRRKSC
jgi:hypothetical protein